MAMRGLQVPGYSNSAQVSGTLHRVLEEIEQEERMDLPGEGLDCANTTKEMRRVNTSSRRDSRVAKLRACRILHSRLNLQGGRRAPGLH
eukprot:1150742-Pelagomonas_calceolata.AAC.2